MTISIVSLLTTKHADNPDTVHGENSFWKTLGAEYAEKFFAGVTRHKGDAELEYYLLTDSPELTPAGVTPILLPETPRMPGWWSKMALFKPGLLPERKTLYSDLDNVVCGPLAPLLSLKPAGLYPVLMTDDVIYPGLPNGSTMLLQLDSRLRRLWSIYAQIPDQWHEIYSVWPHAADQAFIAAQAFVKPSALLQPLLPPKYLLNARVELEAGVPYDQTSIVFGSASPKPHQSSHRFYTEHWRV